MFLKRRNKKQRKLKNITRDIYTSKLLIYQKQMVYSSIYLSLQIENDESRFNELLDALQFI